MNIDERLEQLARSVEGLKDSVELLASFTKDNQQMIVSVAREVREVNAKHNRLEALTADIAESTAFLIQLGREHENRIRSLEVRQ